MKANGRRVGVCLLVLLCCCFLGLSARAADVKLVFAQRNPTEVGAGQAWARAVAEYQKENPHVEFDYVTDLDGNHAKYLEKILVLGASVGFPDIMHIYNLWLYDLVEQGVIDPVPSDVLGRIKNSIYPDSLTYLEYEGVQYAIPTESQVAGLVYNRQLLSEAGVGSVPGTWADLISLTKRLLGQQQTPGKLSGLSVNAGGWGWSANWHMLTKAYGGSYTAADGSVSLDTDANRDLLENIVDWFGADGPGNTNRDAFCGGNVYFGVAFPFWSTGMTGSFPQNWNEIFGVAELPSGPVATGGFQYGWGLGVSANSRNRAEAWKFVEWMATQQTEAGLTSIGDFQLALGSLPTHRRDLQSSVFAQRVSFYNGFISNLPHAVSEPKLPHGDARQGILANEITNAIARRKTPQQALNDATIAINALLK